MVALAGGSSYVLLCRCLAMIVDLHVWKRIVCVRADPQFSHVACDYDTSMTQNVQVDKPSVLGGIVVSLSLFVWLACGTLGMQRSSTARTGVLLRSYWLKVGWVTQGLSVSWGGRCQFYPHWWYY